MTSEDARRTVRKYVGLGSRFHELPAAPEGVYGSVGMDAFWFTVERKPEWMRHATYERLWDAWCREELIRDRAIQHFIETRMPGGF